MGFGIDSGGGIHFTRPLIDTVERFMFLLYLESWGKLGDLGIDSDYLSSLNRKLALESYFLF